MEIQEKKVFQNQINHCFFSSLFSVTVCLPLVVCFHRFMLSILTGRTLLVVKLSFQFSVLSNCKSVKTSLCKRDKFYKPLKKVKYGFSLTKPLQKNDIPLFQEVKWETTHFWVPTSSPCKSKISLFLVQFLLLCTLLHLHLDVVPARLVL